MAFFFICFVLQITFTCLESIEYPCLSKSICGCSLKPVTSTKIIGGEIAKVDSWGWAVSIRSRNNHICGGSLISWDLVLTAAHCVESVNAMSRYSVTAGSINLSIIKQQRSASKIFIHRNYRSLTNENDLALIRLSLPFNMNDSSLTLICLPTNKINYNTSNIDVIAIGWGKLSTNDNIIPDTLRQVTLKTVADFNPACQRSIHNENVQLCAGVAKGGKDTCQGDSGGPLMMFVNNRWHLLGITSYGRGCGVTGYAGVYTRVSAYENPINYVLNNDIVNIEKTFIIKNSVSSIFTSFCLNNFLIFLIIYLTNK